MADKMMRISGLYIDDNGIGKAKGIRTDEDGNLRTGIIKTEILVEREKLSRGSRKLIHAKTLQGYRVAIKIHDGASAGEWELNNLPLIEGDGSEWLSAGDRKTLLRSNGESFVYSEVRLPISDRNRFELRHLSSSEVDEIEYSILLVHYPISSDSAIEISNASIAMPVDLQYVGVKNVEEILVEDNLKIPGGNSVSVSKFSVANYKYINVFVKETNDFNHDFDVHVIPFDENGDGFSYAVRSKHEIRNGHYIFTEKEVVKSSRSRVTIYNKSEEERNYKVIVQGFRW